MGDGAPLKNSVCPPYRLHGKTRFVRINGDWISTAAIESIRKSPEGTVVIRTLSGDSIPVHGVHSPDALARNVLGPRQDDPADS